jgi:hypothetical protein
VEEDQTESELREEEEVSERAIFLRIHPYIDTDGYAPFPDDPRAVCVACLAGRGGCV